MEKNLVIISTKGNEHYVHKLNEPQTIFGGPYGQGEAIQKAYKLIPEEGGKVLFMGEQKDIHMEL